MAKDVKPTRKNLMAIEDRIDLSERGHDTLEQKRDGLIMEFMDILDQAQDVRSDVSRTTRRPSARSTWPVRWRATSPSAARPRR